VSYKLAALLSSKPDWEGTDRVLARALSDPRAGNELKAILQAGMAKARDKASSTSARCANAVHDGGSTGLLNTLLYHSF
jgi:hypothetical protein